MYLGREAHGDAAASCGCMCGFQAALERATAIASVDRRVKHALSLCRDIANHPTVSQRSCIGCGELRASAWFSSAISPTGLKARCRMCAALYNVQHIEMHRIRLESQQPVAEKRCSACKMTLPRGEFHNGGTKDGLCSRCKDCVRSQVQARKMKRKQRSREETLVLAVGEERLCSECSAFKPWADFPKSMNTNFGINSVCKKCKSYQKRVVYPQRRAERDNKI